MFGACFVRPDGFGSSDFAQIVDCFMLYRSIWVSGIDVMKIVDFGAEEGSIFDNLFENNIVQRLAQPRFQLIWGSFGFRGLILSKLSFFLPWIFFCGSS